MGMKEAILEIEIGKAEDPMRVTDLAGRIPGEGRMQEDTDGGSSHL